MSSPPSPIGMLTPWTTWSFHDQLDFLIQQSLVKLQTCTLVKVISCSNEGDVSPIGTVNVQPMVNQVDPFGNPFPHTTIWNVPYFRMQNAGGSAIILDPVAGDLGICCFSSRDLTSVISTQAPANPGSARRYHYADALYIGVALSKTAPTQYIRFTDNGITIVSPVSITLQAPQINLQGDVMQTDGTMSAETDITAGMDSISLIGHMHTSEAPGDPTSPPLP